MLDPSQAEQISAYVDGELSPAQRSSVEQLLAENAAARDLKDDLLALCRRVKLVSQPGLDEDFAARVLRAAEREMLLGGRPRVVTSDAGGPDPAATDRVEVTTPSPRIQSRVGRPSIWFVAGAAAAVFVMLAWPFGPAPPQGNRQIAQNPASEEVDQAPLPRLQGATEPVDSIRDESPDSPAPDDQSEGTRAENRVEKSGIDVALLKQAAPGENAPSIQPSAPSPASEASESPDEQSRFAGGVLTAGAGSSPEPADVVFVVVDLTAEAAQQQVVALVLKEQGIALSQSDLGRTNARSRQLNSENREPPTLEAEDVTRLTAAEAGDELLIVESTPAQLTALLADLTQREGVVTETRVRIPQAFFGPVPTSDQETADLRLGALNEPAAEAGEEPTPDKTTAAGESAAGPRQAPREEDRNSLSTAEGRPVQARAIRLPRAVTVERLSDQAHRGVSAHAAGQAKITRRESLTSDLSAATAANIVDLRNTPWVRSVWLLRVMPSTPPAASPTNP